MAKNPEKKLGVTGNCYKCNGLMTCGEGFEKKPTWQNSDGKSHYNKDGTCRGQVNTGEVIATTNITKPQPESKPVWEQPEDISDDQQLLSDGLKQMRYLAYVFTKECHPELPDSSNLFGQIVNANITHLIGMAQIKATKENN